MATARGRGISMRGRANEACQNVQPLRRPGEATIKKLDMPTQLRESVNGQKSDFDLLTDKLNSLELTITVDKELQDIADSMKRLCANPKDVELAADKVYNFSLTSRANSHFGAILSSMLSDFEVGGTKFKFNLLRKVQNDYNERKLKYTQIDKFLLNVAFLCEIFHHMRLPTGDAFAVFVCPIIDYFLMLVEGGSEKEIEVFVEQIPKLYKDLKTRQPEEFENLVIKIRKKIVSESASVIVRSFLLEIFEKICTDWAPFNSKTSDFYEVFTKPVNRICE